MFMINFKFKQKLTYPILCYFVPDTSWTVNKYNTKYIILVWHMSTKFFSFWTETIDIHASQIICNEYILKYHPKLLFFQINQYSNNHGCNLKLIFNFVQTTQFCTDCCFVIFRSWKICHLWNVFTPIIMTVHERVRGTAKFSSHKTILGAIVYGKNQYPIDPERLKYHW